MSTDNDQELLEEMLTSLDSLAHDLALQQRTIHERISKTESSIEGMAKHADGSEDLEINRHVERTLQEVNDALSGDVYASSVESLQQLAARLEQGRKELERLQASKTLQMANMKEEARKLTDELERTRKECTLQQQCTEQKLVELRAKFRDAIASSDQLVAGQGRSTNEVDEISQRRILEEKDQMIETLEVQLEAANEVQLSNSSKIKELQAQLDLARQAELKYTSKMSEMQSKINAVDTKHQAASSFRGGGDRFDIYKDDDEVFEAAFKSIDKDNNGYITADELDQAIKAEESRGKSTCAVGYQALKDLVKVSGDSQIMIEDFKAAARKLPRLSGQRVHWAQTLGLESTFAKYLPLGNLFDGLQGLRETNETELTRVCGEFCNEVLGIVKSEWEKLRMLDSAPSNSTSTASGDPHGDVEIRSVMSKFVDSGGFMGKFGDAELFHTGLEKELGYPNPDILKSILREHTSAELFVTGNYGLATSDFLEFVRQFMAEDQRGQLPVVFLKEMAESVSNRGKGPDMNQVKDIESELKKMEGTYLKVQKERNGLFSGEPGDQYTSIAVRAMITAGSNEDAEKLVRFGCKGGQLCKLLTSSIIDSVPGSLRADEAKARGVTVLVPAKADGTVVLLTVLIPCIKFGVLPEDTKICQAFESCAAKLSVRGISVAIHEVTLKTFRYVEKLEPNEDKNLITKVGRIRRSIRELMSIEEVCDAGLRVEEAIVAYLYTGPLFQKWNGVLRNLQEMKRKHEKSRYTTTIHVLVSAIIKLAQKTKVPSGRRVFRGLGGIVLDEKWFTPDARGTRGGVEFGFLSTTLNRNVALEYSGVKQSRGIVLEIDVGAIDCGALLDYLSQYPGEGELVFGPLSYLEVVGQPHFEIFDGHEVVVVSVKINVNLKAQKIEDMIAKRKEIHKASFRFLVDDVRYDLLKTVEEQGPDKLKKRLLRDVTAKDDFDNRDGEEIVKRFTDDFVNEIMRRVEQTRESHEQKSVEDFVSNDIYRSLVLEMLDSSSMAVSKLRLYLEDHAQIRELWRHLPLKVAHRSLIAFLKRTLPDDEGTSNKTFSDMLVNKAANGRRSDAILSLCKLKGLLVKNALEKNEYGETRLMQAAADGLSIQDIKLLGETGVPINASDKLGNTAFLLAAQFGHAEILVVLHHLKADISHKDKMGESALHKAAIDGHVDCLKALADLKADMNQLSSKADDARMPPGMSALMFAALHGHADCMRTLHQLGTNVHYKLVGGVDATYWAVVVGHADCVQAMSDMGVNMEPQHFHQNRDYLTIAEENKSDHVVALLHTLREWSPLMIAINGGDQERVKEMIMSRAEEINVRNKSNRTALHYAARKDSVDIVYALFEAKADINALDIYGKSPLDLASKGYRNTVDSVLKEIGADKWTALMVAAEDGGEKWVHYFQLREAIICHHNRMPFPEWFAGKFHEHGINLNVSNEDKMVGLDNSLWTEEADHLLKEFPNAEMIIDAESQEMRRLGASFLHRIGGRTLEDAATESRIGGVIQKNSPKTVGALFVRLKALEILDKHMSNMVAGKGDPENVRSLILKRADISAKNRYQCTALHIAAASGHEECIYKLFELKADILSKDTLQRTALHHAAQKGRADSVIALIKLRADINATDKFGFSPLDLATDRECTRLLKELGAGGWTQLMVAVETGESASDRYFKVREAVLCMQMRYPFPVWFQIELRDEISKGMSSEDFQLGIDNLQWTEMDDKLVHDLPNDGGSSELEDRLRGQQVGLLSTKSVGAVIVRSHALFLLDRLLKQVIGDDKGNAADSGTKCQVFERGESVMRVLGLALDESMADKQKRNTLQLIISGSDINAVNKDLQTALHVAAERGHVLSVQTLLELNADVESKDSMQRTALHYAAHKGHTKVVKALVDFKASVNVTDVDKLAPLDLTRSKLCAESLRKYGAKEPLRFKRGDEVQLSEFYIKSLEKDSAILSLERKGVLLDIEGDKDSDDEGDYEDPSYQVSFMERPLKRGDIVLQTAQH